VGGREAKPMMAEDFDCLPSLVYREVFVIMSLMVNTSQTSEASPALAFEGSGRRVP